ncbi:MAG: ABC transporter substrate-binding protein [Chloroflexota bacterium]|nr:ABC transporter substrate-binding protein [Chloroflexota bacterium]
MDRGKLVISSSLVLLLLAMFAFGACSGDTATDEPTKTEAATEMPTEVEPVTITIGCMYDLTGPSSGVMTRAQYAVDDYFKYVNETNYLPGVELDWMWGDTKFELSRTTLHYAKFKESGMDIMLSQAGQDAIAVKPKLEKDKIVAVSWGNDFREMSPPGWAFGTIPTYDGWLPAFCKLISETWNYEEEGKPRVISVGVDAEWGRSFEKFTYPFAEDYNVEYGGNLVFPMKSMDFSTYVAQVKKFEPDFVYVIGAFPHEVGLVKELYKQSVDATILACITGVWPVPIFIESLSPEAAAMVQVITPHPVLGDDSPGTNLAREILERYHSDDPEFVAFNNRDVSYCLGFSEAYALVEGIKQTLAEVGSADKIDGDALYSGFKNVNFDLEGFMPNFQWGEERRWGLDYVRLYEFEGDKMVPASEWFKCLTPLELLERVEAE